MNNKSYSLCPWRHLSHSSKCNMITFFYSFLVSGNLLHKLCAVFVGLQTEANSGLQQIAIYNSAMSQPYERAVSRAPSLLMPQSVAVDFRSCQCFSTVQNNMLLRNISGFPCQFGPNQLLKCDVCASGHIWSNLEVDYKITGGCNMCFLLETN